MAGMIRVPQPEMSARHHPSRICRLEGTVFRMKPLLRRPIECTLGVALAIAIPLLSTPSAQTPGVTVIKGRLLAFNDFHGALDAPTGSGGLVNGTPAGGVEYLATHIKRLRAAAEADGEKVITVGAGDMVGASPLLSAAFHDEPTVELLSSLGLNNTAAGEREFDEGVAELRRLQVGGCHPIDGCQDGDPFAGAKFRYLVANVVDKKHHLPILLPADVTTIQGIPVGIVGIALKGTPSLINPAGVQDVDFLDEVQTANFYADLFRVVGVRALVLLIHEGGQQNSPSPLSPSGCANFSGRIASLVARLRPAYGIVVSGHTHRFYTCSLPNSSGANSVVTSAGANGTMITSIGFTLDKKTRTFAGISAQNVIVENGIRMPDGSWAKDAAGNFIRNPGLVDADAESILDKYRTALAPIANRIVGSITGDITRASIATGESALGDVVADAQLAYASVAAGAEIALVDPGLIRADLNFAFSPGGEPAGQVTYGEAFSVQPFSDLVVTQTFTGAQIKSVLEQQFAGFAGQISTRILQVSRGFNYSYDSTHPPGSRILNITLNGVPIDPAAAYRVATSSFLANGGDGFTNLTTGTQRSVAPGFDIDALVVYLQSGAPVSPGPRDRITKVS